jgi:hypothetical protein
MEVSPLVSLFSRHRVLGQLKSARAKCGSAVSKALEGFMTTVLLATILSMAGAFVLATQQGPASGQKPIRR